MWRGKITSGRTHLMRFGAFGSAATTGLISMSCTAGCFGEPPRNMLEIALGVGAVAAMAMSIV